MNAGKTLASAVALVTFGRRRIVGSIKALLAWRQLLAVAWRPPVVRRIAPLETILCLLALMSVPVWGASTGSGSGYGLAVNATVFLGPVVNVGPLANTGTQAAPPDFDTTQTAVSANVVAGILTVTTGALSAQTQSLLAQNSVQSAAQVDNLTVNALTLALGASTVRSTAAVTCAAGFPATAGTTTIVGGTGLLAGISAPAPNTTITVLNLGVQIATVYLNEQVASAGAITVNAIRIELNAVGAVTASVVVGQSSASIADCKPTVTIDVAPAINLLNQGSYVISGTCSAGSGNVVVTLPGAGSSPQATACSPAGTYSATFDANGVAQGTVTITATQTDGGGNIGTATRDTIKDTIVPAVTVDAAPSINAGNQTAYFGVTGSCSESGQPVMVTIGSLNVSPAPPCNSGVWSAPAVDVSALADGPVIVRAEQSDSLGNVGFGTRTTAKDVSAPIVTINTAPPINAANQGNYSGVTGTCSESGLPVNVSVGGIAVTPPPVCTAGGWSAAAINATAIPVGTVAIVAAQTDAAGNSGSATRTTAKDIVAPSATVSTAPLINGANQSAYGGVTGTCSENGLAVVVAIASLVVSPAPLCVGGSWSITGVDVSSVPDGVITVSASQTDAAGNTGSGTRDTSKDATAPTVAITSAPPINVSNSGNYAVSGSCSESGLPVQVSVGSIVVTPPPVCNGGTWSVGGINTTALPEGPVLVSASQTDPAGNTGGTSITTIMDVTLPVVTITSAPAIAQANQSAYVVAGSCSENGVSVTVMIAAITVVPAPICASGAWIGAATNVASLPDGVVVVAATQTDAAGNTGSDTRNTTKDATGPSVAVVTAPAINAANQSSYAGVSGTCSEVGVAVSVDIGGVVVTPAPTCSGSGWIAAAVNVTALPEGTVVVSATQIDTFGNSGSGTLNTVKDLTAPVVTVLTAPPINATNQATYTGVSGACSESGLPVVVTIGGIATPATACVSGAWTAPATNVSAVPEGVVAVIATQTDAAGSSGTGSRNTTKDVTQPVVTVATAPVINVANQTTYDGVTGTCSENGLPVSVSIGSVSVATTNCGANVWSAPVTDVSSVADGVVLVTASQTDTAGNVGSGTRNTTKDATLPLVSVTTAPSINNGNQTSYSGVTGTCSENGRPVAVSIGSIAVSPVPSCSAGAWSAGSVNASGLADGVVTVTASQSDIAGNIGSGSRDTLKDGGVPVVTVTTAPAINFANRLAYSGVTGSCSENGLPVNVTIGSVGASPAPICSSGGWTAPATNVSSLPDGVVVVSAAQTDAAGNVGSGTRNTTKDATLPVVTVATAPPINLANQASYTGVSGSCSENGLPVTVTIGAITASPSPNCTAGSWSAAAINATSVPVGTVTVLASQTDAAGNTGNGTRDTVKDVAAPAVTVSTAPVINASNQVAYGGVTGTCSENGLPVSVVIGNVSAVPAPTCAGGAWSAPATNVASLADGTVLVTATQTDAAGNVGTGSRNTTKDSSLPVVTVITAPLINGANQATYTGVSGNCSEIGLPVTVSIGAINVSPPTCNSGTWTAPTANVSSLADGAVLVVASQTDTAGNVGSGSRTTSKDVSSPTVTVTTAPPINFGNQSSYSGVTGTCSESGLPVSVTIGAIAVAPVPTCSGGAWTAAAINATSLPVGVVTVTASQTDAAGNIGSGTRDTVKDVTLPVVTVTTAPPINNANQASYTGVTGTCSENGLPVSVLIGNVNALPSPNCASNAWTAASVNVAALPDGTVIVTATQTDAAGNTGSDTRNTMKDGTLPLVAVDTAPTIHPGNRAAYSGVTGRCSEAGVPVVINIGGLSLAPSPTCAAGSWSAPVSDVSALPDGPVLVTATQTDAAGNSGTGTRSTNKTSSTPRYAISGSVLHESNGMTDGNINGPAVGLGGLYVYVVDATGMIVGSTAVPAGTSFTVPNIPDGSYRVVLSADGTQTSAPVSSLPGEWVNVGERWAGVSDTVRDGVLEAVVVNGGDVSTVLFSVEMRPQGQDTAATGGVNPGATLHVPISADVMTTATTDPDGQVIGFQITAFPTGADALGVAGQIYTAASFPLGGIFVGIGDVGQISVDPVGSALTDVDVILPYRVVDNANVQSARTYLFTLRFAATTASRSAAPIPVGSTQWLSMLLLLTALATLHRRKA